MVTKKISPGHIWTTLYYVNELQSCTVVWKIIKCIKYLMELFISNKSALELLLDAESVSWLMKLVPRLVALEDVIQSSKTSVRFTGRYGAHSRILQLFNYSAPSAPAVGSLILLAAFKSSHTAVILYRVLHLQTRAIASKLLSSLFSWDFTQRILVSSYRRFGIP